MKTIIYITAILSLIIVLVSACTQQESPKPKIQCDDGSYADTGEQCYIRQLAECKLSDDSRTCSDKNGIHQAKKGYCLDKYTYVNEKYSCEVGKCILDNSGADCRALTSDRGIDNPYIGCVVYDEIASCGDLPRTNT